MSFLPLFPPKILNQNLPQYPDLFTGLLIRLQELFCILSTPKNSDFVNLDIDIFHWRVPKRRLENCQCIVEL